MPKTDLHQNEQHADQFIKFEFDDGTEVRTIILAGDPWFVANDLGIGLMLTNVRKSLQSLEADEKGVTSGYTPGGL